MMVQLGKERFRLVKVFPRPMQAARVSLSDWLALGGKESGGLKTLTAVFCLSILFLSVHNQRVG